MKKLYYLIVLALILGLVLTGCFLSNVGQVPTTEQSGISYLTKGTLLPDDLFGLWLFDEGSGAITIADSSGYGNGGDVYGATTGVPGKFGKALSFDGDDYVQLPASNDILSTDTFTIEAWFKTSVNHPVYGDGDKEGRLVNLHRTTTASTAVSLYVEQGKIGLLYYTGTAHVFVKYTVDYHDDVWHHIAVTHDATTYRLYYDGVEVAFKDDTFGDFGTYPAYLGTYNGSERFFNGIIDEVRIWDGALTEPQIAQSYALGTDTSGAVIELNHKNLLDGGTAIFTSAFYVTRTPTLPVTLETRTMIVDSPAIVNGCTERKITPRGLVDYIPALVTDGVDITVNGFSGGAKSLHLTMDLSIGEGLGFNVQLLPYDYD